MNSLIFEGEVMMSFRPAIPFRTSQASTLKDRCARCLVCHTRKFLEAHSFVQVGVRLEDCFYIDDSGVARYLTEGTGGPQESPWAP